MTAVILNGWIPEPEKKKFKPKYGLNVLSNYDGVAPSDYWEKFPANWNKSGKSMVDPHALMKLAHQVGCEDWNRLFTVCQDLKYGANIGCKGDFRARSTRRNAKSAYKFGEQVSDAIADWITKGFAAGPFAECQVPADAKINSIMTREKPNGSVRIILNLSAPAGLSVNDGINKDEFPASMSSTQKWLEVLDSVGKNCWMAKVD